MNRNNKIIKNNKFLIPYRFFSRAVRWLSSNLLNISYNKTTAVLRIVDKLFKILSTRGKIACIKYAKDLRLSYLKALFNDFSLEDEQSLSIPKMIKPIIRLSKAEGIPFIRLCLSVLYLTRFIRTKPEASFETITNGPAYNADPSEYREEIVSFLVHLGINKKYIGSVPKTLRFKNHHMSTKSGPVGLSTWSALSDLMILPDTLLESIQVLGGNKIRKCIVNTREFIASPMLLILSNLPVGYSFRKLAVISDKEGKTREIAIGDYWSQAILKPLHNYHYRILSKIKQDCTHNQVKHFNTLQADPGSSYHSIDLSSATDRFPIALQREILDVWFGSEYANNWHNIMVGYPFDYQERKIHYATGNPMGFYSSWSTFVIAHHFLVYKACKIAKYSWFKCPYMMLGDDIVIANDMVAQHYKELLKEWDIPYSEEKTHSSAVGFEFAKQIRYHGENVSPLPLSALYSRRRNIYNSINILVDEVRNKDWDCVSSTLVESYVRTMFQFSSKRYAKKSAEIELVLGILSYLRGDHANLGTFIQKYVEKVKGPQTTFTAAHWQLYSNELLIKLMQEKSTNLTQRSEKELLGTGNHLFSRVLVATTQFYGVDNAQKVKEIIDSVPFTSCISRTLLDLVRAKASIQNITAFQRLEPTKFKELFSSDTNPVSAKHLYERNRDVDINTSVTIASKLLSLTMKIDSITLMGRKIPIPWVVPFN